MFYDVFVEGLWRTKYDGSLEFRACASTLPPPAANVGNFFTGQFNPDDKKSIRRPERQIFALQNKRWASSVRTSSVPTVPNKVGVVDQEFAASPPPTVKISQFRVAVSLATALATDTTT